MAEAVRAFALGELTALARKVIFRLQRIRASGIYGDDFAYKTLWDEHCHEVHRGPTGILNSAWDHALNPILSDVVVRIPHHRAALLSKFAVWNDLLDGNPLAVGEVWPDGIRDLLRTELNRVAGQRNIGRFADQR